MILHRRFTLALAMLLGPLHKNTEAACSSASCSNLVFDGDSISAGLGAAPGQGLDTKVASALGGDVRVHNVAVSGRPVSECLRLYPKLVAPLFNPSASHNVIVFHAGDNDVAQGRDAAQTYAAFTSYVAAAHHQGWKVVVSTELQRPDFHPPLSIELGKYNDKLRQNQAAADEVVDFDADSRMTNMSYRHNPAIFTHDGVHPNNAGYAVLADMLAPVVKRTIGR